MLEEKIIYRHKYEIEGITLHEWCKRNGCSYTVAYKLAAEGKTEAEIKKYLLKHYFKREDNIYIDALVATSKWKAAKTSYERNCVRSEFEANWGSHHKYEVLWDEITLGTFVFKGERWLPVPGTKSYECSNQGGVRKKLQGGIYKILHPYAKNRFNKKGKANRKMLAVKCGNKEFALSRLIAEVFIPHTADEKIVLIKDRKWKHVWVENLEWVSRKKAGSKTGYCPSRSIEVERLDDEGNVIETYRSAREAGKALFMSYQTALDYCHGRVRKPMYNLRFKDRGNNL